MFYNLRKKFKLKKFNYLVKSVKNTPPVSTSDKGKVIVLSQVYPGDVLMYLLSVKSFLRFVPAKRIVVVGDRLREEDRELLQTHVNGIEIVNMQETDFPGYPKGSCWERLLVLLSHTADDYVIQLDSDLITTHKPEEVLQAIDENRSFTLGTNYGEKIVTLKEAAEFAYQQWPENNPHVQVMAEKAMADFKGNYFYVRGCAGFAGFQAGQPYHKNLADFNQQMETLLGKDKWSEWGSEQVSSNFLIANTPDPLILPLARYDFFKPGRDLSELNIIHFLGHYRFENGVYLKRAKELIAQL